MSYAKVTLVGNVGRDPEFKAVGEGEVCNFTLATTRKIKGEPVTAWWSVSCWNEQKNKVIGDYVQKGSKLMLVGEPSSRAWLDKNDEAQCALEINITWGDLVLLDRAPREERDQPASKKPARTSARAKVRAPAGAGRDKDMDDDIPF